MYVIKAPTNSYALAHESVNGVSVGWDTDGMRFGTGVGAEMEQIGVQAIALTQPIGVARDTCAALCDSLEQVRAHVRG